jgi:hypothetical protein
MTADYRRRCLDAKSERCSECGSTSNIVVHHVDGDRSNNDLANLIPLCRSCHSKVHTCADGFEHLTEQLPESAIANKPLPPRSIEAIYSEVYDILTHRAAVPENPIEVESLTGSRDRELDEVCSIIRSFVAESEDVELVDGGVQFCTYEHFYNADIQRIQSANDYGYS